MNLIEYYDKLYKKSIKQIENGDYQTDLLIDSPDDNRLGISLLIKPPDKIKTRIQSFLEKLKKIDPSQYYYPSSDIHITVMSIISCYEGFKLDQITISDYIELIRNSIGVIGQFVIRFQGVTASDSSIMIRGFPENEIINNLRNNLRTNFKNSDLEQSIDKRYIIQTAHSTVVRFRNNFQKKKELLKVIEKYKNYDFGNFEVNELELVFNDWYQREKNTKLLEKFELQQRSTTAVIANSGFFTEPNGKKVTEQEKQLYFFYSQKAQVQIKKDNDELLTFVRQKINPDFKFKKKLEDFT